MTRSVLLASALLSCAAILPAQEIREGQAPAAGKSAGIGQDFLLEMNDKEDGWTQILLKQDGKELKYSFGSLGKKVVELHRSVGKSAPLSELAGRVDAIYGGSTAGALPDTGTGPGGSVDASQLQVRQVGSGAADDRTMGRNAYPELLKARAGLARGDFSRARGSLVLVEAALSGMGPDVRSAYENELWALREAYSLPAAKDSIGRLARAARGRDMAARRQAEELFEWWGRHLVDLKTGKPVDRARLDAISREVWAAYSPARGGVPRPGAKPSPGARPGRDGVKGKNGKEQGEMGRLLEEEELGWWERLKRWLAGLTS